MTEQEKSPKASCATGAAEAAPAAKRPRKRAPIAVAVVAAVLVVAGAGLWVWHEQPSFCGAICHVSMDPYLPTYEAEPGQPAEDKWGNEVADASGMMAATHRAADGSTCLSCHVPTLGEQVAEGMSWVSGDYEVVSVGNEGYALIERPLSQLVEARGLGSGEEFCLNDACHVNEDGTPMDRADLVAITADQERNPHVEQHGEVTCDSCHKAHRASVNYCSKCHADAEIPEGWLSVAQEKQLEFRAN